MADESSDDAGASKEHLFVFSNPKAGMDGVDRAKLNQTIYDLSKDSAFFKNSVEKDAAVDKKVAAMRAQLERQKRPHELVANVDRRVAALEHSRDFSRIHVVVDMDMFYAAVEMRDDPSLAHVPMAVGGMGMISTANYEARKFGVRAAMPGFIAKKLCPALVFVSPHFDKYTAVAEQTRAVFREYDPHFISGSLDEAYLDITAQCRARVAAHSTMSLEDAAADVANEIRRRIHDATQLTASAGIASTARLAKVCSDINKPNGQYILPFNKPAVLKFVHHLPVRKFGGIGKVKEKMLTGVLGVTTGRQLYDARYDLFHVFSEGTAQWLLALSMGVAQDTTHHDPQQANANVQKSVSRENTFRATSSLQELLEMCQELVRHVHQDLTEVRIACFLYE
ncbi:Aste57867_665 [Aphanomyces stellatus]|uniref:DNA polymerase kappa n=1 Tax=Aphanomyces stellatus TaxID=120398 RepID=A0A485K8F2_9STRA|nr:hypothetical protein As57867_000664 [Aphanomyces stellatus]VFT77890.1 Aste57867_665 [Aphanomyces stellatus]